MKSWTLGRFVFLAVAVSAISAPAWASTLYGVTFGDQIVTINTTTGAGSVVGNLTSSVSSFDLGVYNNNLLVYDQNADTFREINPTNAQTVANIGIGAGHLFAEGSFAVNSGGTGFIDSGTLGFYSFNLNTGTSNLIKPAGGILFDGMALSSGGTLFGVDQGGDTLYTINTATGAATVVGSTGISGSLSYDLAGLTFDSSGNLYLALSDDVSNNNLYSVNSTTGAATLIGAMGAGMTVSGISFFTPSATTPEPASLLPTAVGLLLAGMVFRRRRSV